MIKTTCGLLADRNLQNEVGRLAWDVHRRHATGLLGRRLPAHVSLKQPFAIDDEFAGFEKYVHGLAARIEPCEIELDGFFSWPGVFGVQVRESPALRNLHTLLNVELGGLFGDVRADFDGDAYQFHMTIAAGGASAAVYGDIGEEYAAVGFRRSFLARELGIFVYDVQDDGGFDFMLHSIVPVGGA
jgi:2'-5' RNA ligase